MDAVHDVLATMRSRGVHLWMENGALRYRAPHGALSGDEIASLKQVRRQIVALLEDLPGNTAPLTYTQLAHWNTFQLGERRAMRQIVSATRLRGELNVPALQASLNALVERHEALRTRIVVCEGAPMQVVDSSTESQLRCFDLREVPRSGQEREVREHIDQHILEPIDVATGPLFGSRLLRLCEREYVLIVAMEHLIADGQSLNIVMRELFALYQEMSGGGAANLPEVALRFSDYATRQRNALGASAREKNLELLRLLQELPPLRFPSDPVDVEPSGASWGIVSLQLDRNMRSRLAQVARARQTTLVMNVLTLYVALVMRWCGAREGVIRLQTDGRNDPAIAGTVGYFATCVYPRIRWHRGDTFPDLHREVLNAYCEAHAQADSGWFEAQQPRPAFTRSPGFNWIPGVPRAALDLRPDVLSSASVPFVHPLAHRYREEGEPSIVFFDSEEEGVRGEIWFPRRRFREATLQRFAGEFLALVRKFLKQPDSPIP